MIFTVETALTEERSRWRKRREAQARAAINAWCSGKETTEKSRNLSGKILIAVAVLLVIILLFLR
ncbi:MAG: hypothetical protein ACLR2E_21430 [Lachnospiraceae bacterium]